MSPEDAPVNSNINRDGALAAELRACGGVKSQWFLVVSS